MKIRRQQLFEFNDQTWFPEPLRIAMIETLGQALRWSRHYDPALPVVAEFLARAGSTAGADNRVLDLCSGSGEPVAGLLEAMRRKGIHAPQFLLSDRFPNLTALQGLARRYPDSIEVVPSPLDATDVPAELASLPRTILSAFHHFSPELARGILLDSVRKRAPVLILEPFPRSIRPWLATIPALYAALWVNPLVTEGNRLQRALLNWCTPLLHLTGGWDALVSLLRQYEGEELTELVPTESGYDWQYRQIATGAGRRISLFMGLPQR